MKSFKIKNSDRDFQCYTVIIIYLVYNNIH